ncbi:hypothetical protein [Candidatus Thiosymbion oneisti]|uniref:hypothetical protein n=1 Tax=Candidatus Thiosymbion oneisti TaxID=589554 RepID=UPI0013FD64DE|nr:hypothetical protein [Candidatus Thiosymbion oneisti]
MDTLYGLKQTMHGEANASVNRQLNEAIILIQQCIENGSADTDMNNKVLSVIGKVLQKIPSIAALLKLFSD